MKKDYLWDKTGEDPEIEMLENALQAFRYQDTAAPELPAKILPFKKEPSRIFFRSAMAAACLMFGLFVFAVWFQAFNNKTVTENDLAAVNTPWRKVSSTDEQPIRESHNEAINTPEIQPLKRLEKTKRTSEQKLVRIRNTVRANSHQGEEKARNVKKEEPSVILTKEEQYAYDQLMLALSITSSKLKIVKDKAQSLEEQTAVFENGK